MSAPVEGDVVEPGAAPTAADAERRARAEAAATCDAFAGRKGGAAVTSSVAADEANVARWLARRIRGEVSNAG